MAAACYQYVMGTTAKMVFAAAEERVFFIQISEKSPGIAAIEFFATKDFDTKIAVPGNFSAFYRPASAGSSGGILMDASMPAVKTMSAFMFAWSDQVQLVYSDGIILLFTPVHAFDVTLNPRVSIL